MPNKKKRQDLKHGAYQELDEPSHEEAVRCEKKKKKKNGYELIDEPVILPTLVSLAVPDAFADGPRWWTVVMPAGGVEVVATTTPDDNAGEWSQINWTGIGTTLEPPNRRRVGRVMARDDVQVSASLNGPIQTVHIDVYDLTALNCNLRTSRPGNIWKDYAGFVAAGVARVSATTVPAADRAWNKLVWLPAGAVGPAANQRDYSGADVALGDHAVRVTLGGKEIRGTLHICQWPVLALADIAFSGGHTVNNDTIADFDNHWQAGRANGAFLDPAPLCYTRHTAITLTATLNVTTAPTEPEVVTVRGRTTVGVTNITWTSGAITVRPGDAQVSFPAAVAGNALLPNQVAAYSPMIIQWEMSDPNGGWINIGVTQHTVYVTLGAPLAAPIYRTLLHYSCTHAAAATTHQALITGTFQPLAGRNIIRQRDNVPLTYWLPSNVAGGNGNTALLLAEPTGAGHCGAWAEFFIDALRMHGINTGQKVNVTRADAVSAQALPVPVNVSPAVPRGFLVANWNFTPVPATSPTLLTHAQWGNCTTGVHAPGQNNPTPPASFYNHFVVHCTTDGRIYDPSYGNSFANPAAWEPASISGLFSDQDPFMAHPTAGYSPVGGAGRLLRFDNLVTHIDL